MNQTNLKVLVIDDHPLIRAGLCRLIELEDGLQICGEFDDGKGCVEFVSRLEPDVVILDLTLKASHGIEVIKDLRAADIKTPILVVSMHDEITYAERVINSGGNGYLMKDEANLKIVEGIRTVLSGEVFISQPMQRIMLRRMSGQDDRESGGVSIGRLTDRELEVFQLIGNGKSSREIGETLGISHKTVDAHRAKIKSKLRIRDARALVAQAAKWSDAFPNRSH
ncbi:MAG: response regulator transcription factor [Verrucomicrobiales bacterium]|nr:response regulator transcription factor [Verrucomicrobiales bacterium]